ncbi:MAG: biotin transporter BioY [Lachnospiraceae bacterium]|nr:biotin transporter BioY [Lachnospiraceae bacterium]
MTAVLCILGPLAMPIFISPVPVSFVMFGAYLVSYILDKRDAVICMIMYVFAGIIGLPVFSGFQGGIGKLLGPTGGYIIGYVLLVAIGSYGIEKANGKTGLEILSMISGTAVCYLLGTIWLANYLKMTFFAALMIGVVPYAVADFVKMILAIILGRKIRKRTGIMN